MRAVEWLTDWLLYPYRAISNELYRRRLDRAIKAGDPTVTKWLRELGDAS